MTQKMHQQNFDQFQWKTTFSFESLTAEDKKWYFSKTIATYMNKYSINEKNYKFEKMDEFCFFSFYHFQKNLYFYH